MGNENESMPVVMLDPADVQAVTEAQSQIRAAMTTAAEVLSRYLPEGAVGVSVHASVREDATVYGNVQVRNGYGDGTVRGCALFNDLGTDTILRTFDRACADFTRQMEERDAEND
jgi:hypothetical protein